jgi:hypothetical protein
MLIAEIFAAAKKCPSILVTTYDRGLMPEKSWNLTEPGLVRVLRYPFSAC